MLGGSLLGGFVSFFGDKMTDWDEVFTRTNEIRKTIKPSWFNEGDPTVEALGLAMLECGIVDDVDQYLELEWA